MGRLREDVPGRLRYGCPAMREGAGFTEPSRFTFRAVHRKPAKAEPQQKELKEKYEKTCQMYTTMQHCAAKLNLYVYLWCQSG